MIQINAHRILSIYLSDDASEWVTNGCLDTQTAISHRDWNLRMSPEKPIDERDIDQLLEVLTDRQIADLFDMSDEAVARLRRDRRLDRWKNPSHDT